METTTNLTMCDKKGSEGSLYYDTADDPSIAGGSLCTSPVWVFNKAVTGDLEMNDTVSEQELSSRDPQMVYKQYAESKPDLEISGELMFDPLYEGFSYVDSIRPGSFARNFLALSGPISQVGEIGWKGKFRNFDFARSFPEEGAPKQKFKLKPAACINAGCRIQAVEIATANTVTTYNPGTFVAADDITELVKSIKALTLYKVLARRDYADDEVAYADVSPLFKVFSEEQIDGVLESLVESRPMVPVLPTRSAMRVKQTRVGLGGFNCKALKALFDEIVNNA